MNIALLLTGSFTALGIGYFCIDAYRHRNRVSPQSSSTTTDFISNGSEYVAFPDVPCPDGHDLNAAGHAISHAGHAVGESAEAAINGVEQSVEAIAHTLSHLH